MRRRSRKKQQAGSPNRHRDVFSKTKGYVCFSVDSHPSRARQAQSSSLLDLLRSQTEDYNKGILNEDSVSGNRSATLTVLSRCMHATPTCLGPRQKTTRKELLNEKKV